MRSFIYASDYCRAIPDLGVIYKINFTIHVYWVLEPNNAKAFRTIVKAGESVDQISYIYHI